MDLAMVEILILFGEYRICVNQKKKEKEKRKRKKYIKKISERDRYSFVGVCERKNLGY